MVRWLIAVAWLLGVSGAAADGRIYASDITPEINDQRALIVFDGSRQSMLIENVVRLPEGGGVPALGWVIPVPAVPEIAVAERYWVRGIFRSLRRQSDPVTVPIIPFVLGVPLLALLLGRWLFRDYEDDRRTLRSAFWLAVIGTVLIVVAVPDPTESSRRRPAVEVLKSLEAGPFDVNVIRAASGAEIVGWLKSRGFRYEERDVAAVDDYVRRGWVFATGRLTPKEEKARFEGQSVTPPLVLSFPTKQVVYPLALTGAGSGDLSLSLYILSVMRLEAGSALEVTFAGRVHSRLEFGARPERRDGGPSATDLMQAPDLAQRPLYLTRLSGKLAPAQMKQDLIFSDSGKGDHLERAFGPLFLFWMGGALVIAMAAFVLRLSGDGKFQLSPLAWFAIAVALSSPLALMLLLGSAARQYWRYRALRRQLRERSVVPKRP